MSAKAMIEQMPAAFDAAAAADVDAVIQYNCSTPMHMVIQNGECAVGEGAHDSPTVTVTMEDDDLIEMLNGELDGMTAFMTGKLQIDGDIMLAQRMGSFFDRSKLD